VSQGQITGFGEIGSAQIAVAPVNPGNPDTPISGHITFGELDLGPSAIYEVTIAGRNPGAWDHHAVQRNLLLGGVLKLSVPDSVAAAVLPTDSFEILTPGAGCNVSGEFLNVRVGERVATTDEKGSFLLDYAAPGSKALVLRDFEGIPFQLTNLDAALEYGLFKKNRIGLSGLGSIHVAGQAVLTPGVQLRDFGGGHFVVEIIDGYDPAQDQIALLSTQFVLAGNRLKTVTDNLDIGAWNLAGAQLSFDFSANATPEIVQSLLREVFYFNSQFHLDAFVTGRELFGARKVRIILKRKRGLPSTRRVSPSFRALKVLMLARTLAFAFVGVPSLVGCDPFPQPLKNRAAQAPSTLSLPLFHAIESLMKQTPGGQRLAALYREHSPELVRIAVTHTELIGQVSVVIDQFQPGLEALLSGRGGSLQISPSILPL
jgi:hypothetical protein